MERAAVAVVDVTAQWSGPREDFYWWEGVILYVGEMPVWAWGMDAEDGPLAWSQIDPPQNIEPNPWP